MAGEFWLSERQWAAIAPLLPTNQPGARRVDDRRVISGIAHMLKHGGRWQDCPACYGPSTTIYNRYHRWSGRGIWAGMLAALVEATPGGLPPDRQHHRQGTSLAGGRKRGADRQAIGRSRGGRGELFTAYVEHVLAPTLAPGDIVVLDNLGSHKGHRARRAIHQAGAHLLFLPPYRPDLNPIEQLFAELKHLMRAAEPRTAENTWRKAGAILDLVSPAECANYLVNSGYASV